MSLIGTTQDITERKRIEAHRTMLANELSHRVKNMLASLQAIVSQTMRRATSVREAGETLEARIQALSVANDLLVGGRSIARPYARCWSKRCSCGGWALC